jgi:hypothetical protein
MVFQRSQRFAPVFATMNVRAVGEVQIVVQFHGGNKLPFLAG